MEEPGNLYEVTNKVILILILLSLPPFLLISSLLFLFSPPSALQFAVEGCGSSFETHITPELLDLLFTTFEHINRFVRETGYKVLSAIVKCPGKIMMISLSLSPSLSLSSFNFLHKCMYITSIMSSLSLSL